MSGTMFRCVPLCVVKLKVVHVVCLTTTTICIPSSSHCNSRTATQSPDGSSRAPMDGTLHVSPAGSLNGHPRIQPWIEQLH